MISLQSGRQSRSVARKKGVKWDFNREVASAALAAV
jgi:hypothetical protein